MEYKLYNSKPLAHSAKGSTWNDHKYISKTVKNGKTYYKYPDGNLYYDSDNPDDVYDYDGNLVDPNDLESYTYYKMLRDEDNNTVDKINKKSHEGALISYGYGNTSTTYNGDRISHIVYENGKGWLSSTKAVSNLIDNIVVSASNGRGDKVTRKAGSVTYVHTKGKIEQAWDKGRNWLSKALISLGKKIAK